MVKKIRVFVSYRWESEEFRKDVWNLASWLTNVGGGSLEIISDHLFSNRPPAEGWQRWMANQIIGSEIVLCICTSGYRKRFEGTDADLTEGFGSTHEGLIINSDFYSSNGSNTKFYPILPDGGTFINIPLILQPYFNGWEFPSKNQAIFDLILGENPRHEFSGTLNSNPGPDAIIALEDVIVSDISSASEIIDTTMSFDIHVLVRSYLALSEAEKSSLMEQFSGVLDVDEDNPDERDRVFLAAVSQRGDLAKLWEILNEITPFENQQNPFER